MVCTPACFQGSMGEEEKKEKEEVRSIDKPLMIK